LSREDREEAAVVFSRRNDEAKIATIQVKERATNQIENFVFCVRVNAFL
jgi:hypothetical protein